MFLLHFLLKSGKNIDFTTRKCVFKAQIVEKTEVLTTFTTEKWKTQRLRDEKMPFLGSNRRKNRGFN